MRRVLMFLSENCRTESGIYNIIFPSEFRELILV